MNDRTRVTRAGGTGAGGCSILVVDDNQSLLTTLSMVLKHHGYVVDTSSSGEGAIELVRKRPYAMIFMDVKMPVMNGVQTFKRIKEIRPDAMVIMMTAYQVEDLLSEAMEAGACGVLTKPFDIGKALVMIEEAISGKRGKLVLVVDDDHSTCITLKHILSERGFTTATAFTGEDALVMAKEREYDIVFIDMNLPAMNGLETYLAMKERNPGMVAIMITGYMTEMEDLMLSAMDHRAYACMTKPLDMDRVLKMVDSIIDGKGSDDRPDDRSDSMTHDRSGPRSGYRSGPMPGDRSGSLFDDSSDDRSGSLSHDRSGLLSGDHINHENISVDSRTVMR